MESIKNVHTDIKTQQYRGGEQLYLLGAESTWKSEQMSEHSSIIENYLQSTRVKDIVVKI